MCLLRIIFRENKKAEENEKLFKEKEESLIKRIAYLEKRMEVKPLLNIERIPFSSSLGFLSFIKLEISNPGSEAIIISNLKIKSPAYFCALVGLLDITPWKHPKDINKWYLSEKKAAKIFSLFDEEGRKKIEKELKISQEIEVNSFIKPYDKIQLFYGLYHPQEEIENINNVLRDIGIVSNEQALKPITKVVDENAWPPEYRNALDSLLPA
ncbi:hypothetical protein B488_04790 [Liberibacter crescens BT-1]|uniref:Uncharacterized protein n=2 Tax=Liberibacter crescens TaxID=1273132 RepID=L0EVQ2_LIBCB|nr:hypothetical protein B488_04790 [Liberibacter crescens BT-1]